MIHLFYDVPLEEIVASESLGELVAIALRHRLQLPTELIMLFKVIVMSEAIGAQLDRTSG